MKQGLLSLSPEELAVLLEDAGYPAFRAKQVYGWLIKGAEFDEMTTLPLDMRQALAAQFALGGARVEKRFESKRDSTWKYLFVFEDLNLAEGVLMRYRYGNTLCISSQVGCRMGCSFCASTLQGLERNLSAGEMLGQVVSAGKDLGGEANGQRPVTNIVMMGSGEPLDNYENSVRFIRLVSHKEGLNISPRNISLSTCGLVPEMRRLAEEGLPVTLSVSLHAARDSLRQNLMPIARRYTIGDVMEAARFFVQRTGRRVIFEYALMDEVNDSLEDAKLLCALLKGMQSHVNLIPLNRVQETGLGGSKPAKIAAFMKALEVGHISVSMRRELGTDIEGACGQLRRRFLEEKE